MQRKLFDLNAHRKDTELNATQWSTAKRHLLPLCMRPRQASRAPHTHVPRANITRVPCQEHGADRSSCADRPEPLELLLEDELDARDDLDVQRARRAPRRAWSPHLCGRHWGRGWLPSHPRHGLDHLAHLRQLHRNPTTFPARLPRRITRTAPEQLCQDSSLHNATDGHGLSFSTPTVGRWVC